MTQPAPLAIQKQMAIDLLKKRIGELDDLGREAATRSHPLFETPTRDEEFAHKCQLLDSDLQKTIERVFGKETQASAFYQQQIPNFSALYESFLPVKLRRGKQKVQLQQLAEFFRVPIATAQVTLNHAIKSVDEMIETESMITAPTSRTISRERERRVFIVHGHDDGVREGVARFMEQINFKVVILHEKVNQGRTVIEKFEANTDVEFAIVLLTPDDVGGKDVHNLQARARQNVILELGYFVGRLGRERVVALRKGKLELPSDILGVVAESIDEQGAWKQKLAKELAAAGYVIDWDKFMQ